MCHTCESSNNTTPNNINIVPDVNNIIPNVNNIVPNVNNIVPNVNNIVPNVNNIVPNVNNIVPNVNNIASNINNINIVPITISITNPAQTTSTKFICPLCQKELNSLAILSRHRLHSCANNPNKTPRKRSCGSSK